MIHSQQPTFATEANGTGATPGVSVFDIGRILTSNWRKLVAVPLVLSIAAYGASFLIAPTFTARTLFLPPQPQQQGAASALASLGALAGLAGAAGGVKTTGDQYLSLMQSSTVEDRIIDRFDLMKLYEDKYRDGTRKKLERNVRMNLGKKDGMITLEVDAPSPQLAADMANQFVEELRRLTGDLALSEAKQRRVFFESELSHVKTRLTEAQIALQRTGFTAGALNTEPRSAAEAYARLKAELTTAEVRLQTLRRSLTEGASEIGQQTATVAALRAQVAKLEATTRDNTKDADYVGAYREFKYQETLFELFSKQYEAARLDEAREGSLIQVIDPAMPPERKSKPTRSLIAIGTLLGSFVVLAFFLIGRHFWRVERARQLPTGF